MSVKPTLTLSKNLFVKKFDKEPKNLIFAWIYNMRENDK